VIHVDKVNLPKQNNRYRGPIESSKLENILNMLAHSVAQLESSLLNMYNELGRMKLHSTALYEAIYRPWTQSCPQSCPAARNGDDVQ
jgi:hypothetical protein